MMSRKRRRKRDRQLVRVLRRDLEAYLHRPSLDGHPVRQKMRTNLRALLDRMRS